MADLPAELQTRVALGRAVVLLLDRGDLETATLFARAFVAQGAVIRERRDRGAGR